jgi:hypothetical protein
MKTIIFTEPELADFVRGIVAKTVDTVIEKRKPGWFSKTLYSYADLAKIYGTTKEAIYQQVRKSNLTPRKLGKNTSITIEQYESLFNPVDS